MSFESSLIPPTNSSGGIQKDQRLSCFKIITERVDKRVSNFSFHRPQDFHLFPSVKLSSCQLFRSSNISSEPINAQNIFCEMRILRHLRLFTGARAHSLKKMFDCGSSNNPCLASYTSSESSIRVSITVAITYIDNYFLSK